MINELKLRSNNTGTKNVCIWQVFPHVHSLRNSFNLLNRGHVEHAFNLNRDEEDKPKMHVLEEIPSKQNNRYTC